jgi:sulfate adenylyltransferase
LYGGKKLSEPHGGKLVNRILEKKEREKIKDEIKALHKIVVTDDTVNDIWNISIGAFSPLEGFLEHEDFRTVLYGRRLRNGVPWTIPITLDVSKSDIPDIKEGDTVILIDKTKRPIASLNITDIFNFDKEETAKHVYGTKDKAHPGVVKTFRMKELMLGGKIGLINEPPSPFEKYRLKPIETRRMFKEKGWKTIVGFQTRNIPHLGHEYIQKTSLSFVDGLFIQPIIGKKKKGDFKDEVIIAAYQALIDNYHSNDRVILGILQQEMRYAGPREAIFHAIIRKNFGCTHFVVGRDHAGVGDFYSPYAAQQIFEEFPDLGVTPLTFPSVFFCTRCNGMANEKICPHSIEYCLKISGTKIREAINKGEALTDLIRPEIAKVVKSWENPFV